PPAVVVDLRSPGEQQHEHPLVGLPSQHLNLPLLSALDPAKGWAADLPELYGRVVQEAPHLLVSFVDTVAATDGAVLVHCAAGKDRTGISVALVLRLLGVEHDPVIQDYLLTEQAREEIDRRLRRDDDYAVPAAFFDVRSDALEIALEAWDDHGDGVAGWYLAAGGSEHRLAALRAGMIDQLPASPDNASPLSR
ncbi:MAG: tyrosine-protein phosphatase, partial [Actinomycetales bacterium]